MRVLITGDWHGRLQEMYEEAARHNPDVIVGLGDTGLWPDPAKADKASIRHGLFTKQYMPYLTGEAKIPILTYTIKGNHEPPKFLGEERNEIIPGLIYVPNGEVLEIGGVRFGVIGGAYSPTSFGKLDLKGSRRRHYNEFDMMLLKEAGFHVLLSHDGPLTPELPIGSQELTDFIAQTKPNSVYHGHHHRRYDSNVAGVPIIGLDKIGGRGERMKLYEP